MKTIGGIIVVDSEYEDFIEIDYNPNEIDEATRRAEELHEKTRKHSYTTRELWSKLTGRSISLLDDHMMRLTCTEELYGTAQVLEALEFVFAYHPGQRWEPESLFSYINKRLQARRADAANTETFKTAEDLYVDKLTRYMRRQGQELSAKAAIQEVLRKW